MFCCDCTEMVNQKEADKVADSFSDAFDRMVLCFPCAEERWKVREAIDLERATEYNAADFARDYPNGEPRND